MKKYFAFLMMVAAALVGCSQEEQPNVVEQPEVIDQPETPTTYTMTVTATKSNDALTRALSLGNDGSTLNAMWKAGETVTVFALNWDHLPAFNVYLGTLTAQSDGESTTLEGILTNPLPAVPSEYQDKMTVTPIQLVYPRFPFEFTGQKGTLADIAANFDYASCAISNWTETNGHITYDGTVAFDNRNAIVRFTLQDKAGNAINAKTLTLHDGSIEPEAFVLSFDEVDLTVGDLEINLENASSEVWVSIYGAFGTSPLTLTATTEEGDTYTYTKPGVVFRYGHFYSITVKMTKLLSLTVRDETTEDVGNQTIYYLDGETWADAIANHPTVNAGWAITGNGNVVVYNGYSLCYYDEEDTAVTKDDTINKDIDYYLIWD